MSKIAAPRRTHRGVAQEFHWSNTKHEEVHSAMKQWMKLAVMMLLVGAMVCGGVQHAAAVSITNGFGLQNPQSSITFNEVVLPHYAPVTTEYGAYGVTFSPSLYYCQSCGPYPNFSGNSLLNRGLVPSFSIHFTQDQTAAAFAMVTNPGTSVFTALLDGNVVEQFSAFTAAGPANTNNYYGFSNILFDEIRIDPGGYLNAMVLDNLEFSPAPAPVPEPGSLLLLGSGLVSMLGYGWRKR